MKVNISDFFWVHMRMDPHDFGLPLDPLPDPASNLIIYTIMNVVMSKSAKILFRVFTYMDRPRSEYEPLLIL
jgi:hypothetical protein